MEKVCQISCNVVLHIFDVVVCTELCRMFVVRDRFFLLQASFGPWPRIRVGPNLLQRMTMAWCVSVTTGRASL